MIAIRALDSLKQPDVWHALSDATRRQLIDLLAIQPQSTSALCAAFPLTRFAVMKHLAVLEDAGLIASRKVGRVRTNYLNAAPLVALYDRWLTPRARGYARGLNAFSKIFGEEETVMTNAANFCEVALDWTIAAPVQRVWAAFFDAPEQWWPHEHRAVGGDAKFNFVAKLGADLCEVSPGGGGVIWYRVFALDPYRSVDLRGDLAARYGGPASSLLHVEFCPGDAVDTTILKLTDSLVGRVSDTMKESVTAGWHAILGNGFAASLL